MITRSTLATIIVLIGVIGAVAQERYVKPVDEANQDPSFVAFRGKLIAAAERRDTAYVVGVLDPKIQLSFGGDSGIAAFKRIWKPQTKKSMFWKEILTVIKNGGSFDRDGGKRKDSFWAPYTFNAFPEDLDAFEYYAVFGTDVNLRKEPRVTAESVAKLSYNIVRVEHELVPKSGKSEYPGWFRVRTFGGLEGFIKREFVRSPVDYRAGFEKKRGRWVMVAFISGD